MLEVGVYVMRVYFNLEVSDMHLMYDLAYLILSKQNVYARTGTLINVYQISKYFSDYMNDYGETGSFKSMYRLVVD